MDYLVPRPPEEVLKETEAYLVRRWGHPGLVNRNESRTVFVENQGCLGLLTLGTPKGVQVFATPEGEGRSRATVSGGRRRYTDKMGAFLKDELGATEAPDPG